ncbi:MAG: OmpA family protein [Anaeromyxobacter sp.]
MRPILALLFLLPSLPLAAPQPDAPGCQDPALFTRLPDYRIYRCKDMQFDGHKMKVGDARKPTVEQVEGHLTQTIYQWTGTGARPSRLQVIRNYQNAGKAKGGEVLFDGDGVTTLRFTKDGHTIWSQVDEYGGQVTVWVVEQQGMKQDVLANADAFASDLATTGHASVYGIYFDTGLSVVKPESGPALAEIAKLLAAQPALKVRLVGHTDSVGGIDPNMKLSQARAEAVRAELVAKHRVGADRLTAHGVGPLAPVASNASEDGKAKNRRVELVAF